jgi:glycosyltransferase involved in cell wall biosynthesis
MTSPTAPLVSVVTPFHNTADYLDECIRSVLAQTYAGFEYILVDNMSTDGSGEIAERWAKEDPRVRLVRTAELLPQVSNYNFALRHITPASKYTKIVQADDWIFPSCLAEMVALAERHPNVGLVSSYYLRDREIRNTGLAVDTVALSGREAARLHLLEGYFLFGSPSQVMYRSDLVRAREDFYREGRLHEDTEVCYELLETADFGFVHQVLSYMRVDEGSIYGRLTDMLPAALDRLIVVTRYGHTFLDDADYAEAERRALQEYYGGVARRILRWAVSGSQREFWDHQRYWLRSIGRRLSTPEIARALVGAVAEIILCPRELLDASRRLAGRRAVRTRAASSHGGA